jgi:hypothetical protein
MFPKRCVSIFQMPNHHQDPLHISHARAYARMLGPMRVCMQECTYAYVCVCVTRAPILLPCSPAGPTNSVENVQFRKKKFVSYRMADAFQQAAMKPKYTAFCRE